MAAVLLVVSVAAVTHSKLECKTLAVAVAVCTEQ
jgi:hypothetical protein